MEQYINSAAQILFALATFIFVIYSIVGLYALNTYGNSKSLTTTVSLMYSVVVLALLVWGWAIISRL
jgi:hypothetical protein